MKEESEKKIRGKNSRGKKRKVEQESKQPENEFNTKDNLVLEPIQKELKHSVHRITK